MRELDKTIILMASKVISAGNVFVLSIFFARLLSKNDYGTYIQFHIIINLGTLMLTMGVPASLYFFLPKSINHRYLINRSFLLMFTLGCLSTLGLSLFRNEISTIFNNKELAEYLPVVGVCVTCLMCNYLIKPIIMVDKKPLVLAFINVLKGVTFLSTMIAALFVKPQISFIAWVLLGNYILDIVIASVILVRYNARYTGVHNSVKLSLREQFKFSLPLAASGLLWLIGREIDKFIISYYLLPAELAVYARGAIELPLIHIIASTLAQTYLPEWVKLSDQLNYGRLLELWHATVVKTAMFMFPVFVLFQLIGQEFIVLLYSNEYAGSALIFSIYLFLVPLQITQYTAIVEASGKTHLISFGYVVQITLNIILSVVMIKKMGSSGPAIVTVASMYFWTGYMIFIIGQIYGWGFYRAFPWVPLMRIMFVSILAGLPLLIMKNLILSQWLSAGTFTGHIVVMGMVSVVFLGLYFLGLIVTRTLSDDDKTYLIGLTYYLRKRGHKVTVN